MPGVTPTVEVAAGLIIRDGKILIAQRRGNASLGGLWEFPGGKRKPDESFEACLRRELANLAPSGVKPVVGLLRRKSLPTHFRPPTYRWFIKSPRAGISSLSDSGSG